MSGFEHYTRELSEVDRELAHYAALCSLDLTDQAALHALLSTPHETWAADKVRETLQGLLLLRMKIETEMLEQGITPPSLKGG